MTTTIIDNIRSSTAEAMNSAIDTLRDVFAGEVIVPTDAAYDNARKVRNAGVDRHPALIVRPRDVEDVVQAVNFARDLGFKIAVRGGGHSLPGHSVVEGGIVIDMSLMRDVSVDPATRTARVQAGATSADLAPKALDHGLALSTGDTRSVGLGGLTLGGGIGWMVRKQGLTIDNLLGAQIVTADGRIAKACPEENADLFWAVRGGGGNFGVATSFTYRLHADASVVAGVIVEPLTLDVLRGYRDYSVAAPEALSTIAIAMYAPPLPFVPEDRVGELVLLIMVCYAGASDTDKAAAALKPLRDLATPVADVVAPMPYPAIFSFTDFASAPSREAIRSAFLDELPDEALAGIIERLENAPSPLSIIEVRGLGGAVDRVAPDATAFAHRGRKYFFTAVDTVEGDEAMQSHEEWADSVLDLVRPYANGVYVNFLGDEGDDRIREAYPRGTYERLAEIKRQFDPDNLFSLNQNIRPG